MEMERLVTSPRSHADLIARAVDMLFLQSFKSLVSVRELAALALTEDVATIDRRLLELAIQAVYITRDSEETERTKRAGMYLAFLWHKWPADLRARVPEDERKAWEAIYAVHGCGFTDQRASWGPNFRQMFEYAEQPETYRLDYKHLSNTAHGSPAMLVHDYAQPVVPVHDDRMVPHLLLCGARYAFATIRVWDDVFHVADVAKLEELRQLLTAGAT
jgi:hypothetical protein